MFHAKQGYLGLWLLTVLSGCAAPAPVPAAPPVEEARVVATVPPAGAPPVEPSPTEEWSEEETPPPLAPHSCANEELRSVADALRVPLETLRATAPGIHETPELGGELTGRSYWLLEAELDDGEPAEVLRRLARAHLRPTPGDFVFYVKVGAEPLRTAPELAAAFDTGGSVDPREEAALDDLATALESALAAHPSLRAFSLQSGWADAVGAALHGVAILSPAGDEVLWVHIEEVWRE
ncbi:MAG: hypothetical protein HY907_17170 [Deltaproteobacteria bacterium]|nr:hypothetical protein [Deltaproteobacteria bacterium]